MSGRDPSQRGRPPKYCPEHTPTKPIKVSTPIQQRTPITNEWTSEIMHNGDETKENQQQTIMQELWCEGGDDGGHSWERESKRGKKPRFCPDHLQIGQVVRKQELSKEKAQENQEATLARVSAHQQRVQAAEVVDDIAYQSYMENKNSTNEFNNWIKTNSRLLNEIISLRSVESKLFIL